MRTNAVAHLAAGAENRPGTALAGCSAPAPRPTAEQASDLRKGSTLPGQRADKVTSAADGKLTVTLGDGKTLKGHTARRVLSRPAASS
jgi:hypothetical protein